MGIIKCRWFLSLIISFGPGKGGGERVCYGYKGKGVTIHSLVDGQGLPLAMCVTAANESEREQVIPLLQSIKIQTGQVGRPKSNPSNLAADKGYDSQSLRHQLRQKGIRPEIPKRQWSSKKEERTKDDVEGESICCRTYVCLVSEKVPKDCCSMGTKSKEL